ncbi:hypothetical protein llap_10965 [Limosa lapponica baueri]|uniref:Uncharacterized protein n=1 Tax=Limosa lapponica baueri TaxID=1758121 RepID=A0A2I0TYG0_LIMLA|nr:hypothetical protein llap_10965 [Limosa lapponica baueri]
MSSSGGYQSDFFSQTLEQCRLRKALKLWHQKCLMLKTIEQSPKHLHGTVCEEPLAMMFSEDLSTSSGFDSSAPATQASQSSLEKEYSFSDSSQQSFSSLLPAEDVTHMPYYSSFLQLHQCAEMPAELGGDLYLQASFPPQSIGYGRNWFVGGQFQSLALQSPDNNVQPLTGYSTWDEDCSSDKEVKSCWHQAERCCLQRYFIVWSARTQQLVKAQQYCRLVQLSRAIHRWLMIYRSQNRAERLLLPHLVERPGVVGPSPAHARIQEKKAEVDLEERDEKWLGRKYLRWWHHTVTLRQCQRDRRLRCLARVWYQWREASRVVILAQVLDQQRLIEKAWRVWRRRHLQSRVVQNFLEEEGRSLLAQVIERWSLCYLQEYGLVQETFVFV